MTSLDISLTKAQSDFLALDCPFPLFVAGLGSGKSYLMGLAAVLSAYHSGGALIGVYEPSHELTRLVAMPNVEMWLQKFGVKYTVNKNEHTIETENPNIGNFLFKSYDNVDLLIGYETYSAHVDEIDTLPTEKAQIVWDKVVSRNRQQPEGVPQQYKEWSETNQRWECKNKTSAYTSPEGFKFCYRTWVQKASKSYQKVHGRTIDNPAISQSYIEERTKTLTPGQIDAYLNGQFVNLTSGTVYNSYDRIAHDSRERIKPNETLYIGCDFNVYNMAATVYVRRNGGQDWHAVAEMCAMRDTPELIETIKERYANLGHKIIMYPDASGGARHSNNANASASDISQLKDAGFIVRASRKNPDVRDRVAATNAAFSSGVLFINQIACPRTADCLEQQSYDKNGKPDKDSGHDHQNDATTYPIAYELPIRRKLYKIDFSFVI